MSLQQLALHFPEPKKGSENELFQLLLVCWALLKIFYRMYYIMPNIVFTVTKYMTACWCSFLTIHNFFRLSPVKKISKLAK